jgi:hypothetical protein
MHSGAPGARWLWGNDQSPGLTAHPQSALTAPSARGSVKSSRWFPGVHRGGGLVLSTGDNERVNSGVPAAHEVSNGPRGSLPSAGAAPFSAKVTPCRPPGARQLAHPGGGTGRRVLGPLARPIPRWEPSVSSGSQYVSWPAAQPLPVGWRIPNAISRESAKVPDGGGLLSTQGGHSCTEGMRKCVDIPCPQGREGGAPHRALRMQCQ